MTVRSLLHKRVVLVTGKGGVGKSSCAVALALSASRHGKRVLLCEMGARSVSGELLGAHNATHTPELVNARDFPGLHVAHLDAHEALKEYLLEHLKLASLVKLAAGNKVLARLWQAMPSVAEMSLLNAIYHLEASTLDGKPRFDTIICDLPATGHALAMLAVPQALRSMLRVGPLAERARQIDALLHDATRTTVCIVTLPEELPCNESVQLAGRLKEQLQIVPSHVLINGVIPDLFNADERRVMDALSASLDAGPGRMLVNAGARNDDLRSNQMQRISELRQRLQTEFVEIAFSARQGLGLVDHIANIISSRAAVTL